MKQWYVYILCNKRNWTLYTWVTNDLIKRVYEHKNKLIKWFTQKYWIDKLVHYEVYDNIYNAIEREKQIKSWKRWDKLNLIESGNSDWIDLYSTIIG